MEENTSGWSRSSQFTPQHLHDGREGRFLEHTKHGCRADTYRSIRGTILA